MYIPKIDNYLEILTDEEVKDFAAINVSEYFKTTREKKKFRKAAISVYVFLTTLDEVENICNQILLRIAYNTITLRF